MENPKFRIFIKLRFNFQGKRVIVTIFHNKILNSKKIVFVNFTITYTEVSYTFQNLDCIKFSIRSLGIITIAPQFYLDS